MALELHSPSSYLNSGSRVSLAAMSSIETEISRDTMISLTALREEYLDSSIDPVDLGFCCIYLGGSVVHRSNLEQVVESGSDWDGLGIVETREDLLELVMHRMSDLMTMLKVERVEGSLDSWTVSLGTHSVCLRLSTDAVQGGYTCY